MAKQVVYSEGRLLTEDGEHVGTSAVSDSGNYAPAINPVTTFGAIGDGAAHYLYDLFSTEAEFLAAYPLAWNVWTYWLKRITRSKPGGGDDPNQSSVSSWENLTVDWVALQEAFETGGYVFAPELEYVTSDTLLVRKNNTTVNFLGSVYQTRGGSRGNMLAIGEGHDIGWTGGWFDGADAFGDNCVTIFQNQATTAQAGWETINARRIILRDVRCFNALLDDTYGGGKAVSVQFGIHGAIVSGLHSLDCDLGVTVEGKTSFTPGGSGPTPSEPYNAVGVAISDCVIERAAIAGYYQKNSSSLDNPLANSVVATNMQFIDCATDAEDTGVICGDRAANLKMQALIVSTTADQITPIRGTWQDGVDLDVTVNANDIYSLVDTRHPIGHNLGSNDIGADGATVRMKAKIRENTATYLIRKSTGSDGEAPTPQRCHFDLEVKGYEIDGVPQTAVAQSNLSPSNLTKVTTFNPGPAPSADIRTSCRVATTADSDLAGLDTIDSVTLIAGDRVLVRRQTAGAANGVYVASTGSWTRAADLDSSGEWAADACVFVEEGGDNGDLWFSFTTDDPIVLGTTALTFTAQTAQVGAIEQVGSEQAIPASGLDAPLITVERADILDVGSDVNISGKQYGNRVHVTDIAVATALGTPASSKWLLQLVGDPRGTITASTASATVTGSASPTLTRFTHELVPGDSLYSVAAGVYTLLGTILSIESATSLTLTAVSNAMVTDAAFSFHDETLTSPALQLVTPA